MAGVLVDVQKNKRQAQLAPLIDVVAALATLQAHEAFCADLLGPEYHYLTDDQVLLRRKAGWIRLRRALHVSIAVLSAERFEENGPGEADWGWDFMVRATLPDGRFEEADGSASYLGMLQSYQNPDRLGRGVEPSRHNVRATALTRAKNRATQDLLGLPEQLPDLMAGAPNCEIKSEEEPRSAQKDIAEVYGDW